MKKILIVDKDTDVLRLLRIKLTAAGYKVSLARDGKEARTMVERENPDLVLTELLLPDINGYAFLSQLIQETSSPPIVMVLSSQGTNEDISTALSKGAVDYITKPFSPQVLLERIRVNLIRANLVESTSEGR